MRKKYANEINNGNNKYDYKKINELYFCGYACYLKMNNVENPLIVEDKVGVYKCILNDNYEWIRMYPKNEKYSITAMLNDKKKIIQWYFDVIKGFGIEDGRIYVDDMYLDVVISPDGKSKILDEKEMIDALEKNEITKQEVETAYETVKKIKNRYEGNISELIDLTKKLYMNLSFGDNSKEKIKKKEEEEER